MKKQSSPDWSDLAGQHFLAFCRNVKSFIRCFSARDVSFMVLSIVCVKALTVYGLVPWAADVLLALLAGIFWSFFGHAAKASLRVAKPAASGATLGSHETLEGAGCANDSSF